MQPAKRVRLDEFLWDEPTEDELTSWELRMIRAFIENRPVENPEALESAKRKGLEAYLQAERDAREAVRHLKACLADWRRPLDATGEMFKQQAERERRVLQDFQRRRVARMEEYWFAVHEQRKAAAAKKRGERPVKATVRTFSEWLRACGAGLTLDNLLEAMRSDDLHERPPLEVEYVDDQQEVVTFVDHKKPVPFKTLAKYLRQVAKQ